LQCPYCREQFVSKGVVQTGEKSFQAAKGKGIVDVESLLAVLDDSRAAEYREVLADGGPVERKLRGDFADAALSLDEALCDGEANWMGQCLEDGTLAFEEIVVHGTDLPEEG
jgi:hypothetical protein